MSLALLLGTVNAACGRPAGSLPPPPPVTPSGSAGAPEPVWTARTGRRFTAPLVSDGQTVYAADVDRKVYAVDLASGQLRWSSRLGGMVTGGIAVGHDTIFAASGRPEGRVYALDARTGQRLWRTSVGAAISPLALIRGTIVLGSNRGVISALDARTGSIRWHRPLGTMRAAAVGTDSGVVVVTMDSLFRVDAADGHVLARSGSPGAIVSPLLRYRGTLVGGTADSLVVAIDPLSLRTHWRVSLDAPVLDAPAAQGDTLYAASRRGSLYRITTDSTATAATLAQLGWPVTAPVTLLGDLVLLGGADGTLRAFRGDGSEAWRLQLPWPVEVAALPLPDGLLAGGGDGDLHRYHQ